MKKILFLLVSMCSLVASAQTYYFAQGNRKGPSTPYGNNTKTGKYITTDDIKMWCESYDEGEPLFVLHGGGVGSTYEMGSLIDSLRAQKKYQVFVLATRGHGRTSLGKKHMSLEQRAKDFAPVIRQLAKGKKAQLVGFSDGAYSSMSIAVNYPELVERVVAIGAGTVKAGYMADQANVKDWEAFDKRFYDQQMALMPEPGRWQEFASDYMKYWHNLNLGREFFSKIQCPVLFMVGDEDDHAPVQTVVDAYFMAPQSRLSIIPKAWHTCWLDNMQASWSAIKGFVNEDIKNMNGSKKVSDIHPVEVEKKELLMTSQSWDGAQLPDYPAGKPQLRTIKYTFSAHSILPKHHHEIMSYGVVNRGQLTLVRESDGKEQTFQKGEVFVETVGTEHHGENRGDEPTEVTVFYITKNGQALSIKSK